MHIPDGNRSGRVLAASSSLLTTFAFFLIGLWSGQAVFFFMALSVAIIGTAELLGNRRAANGMLWVGRGGMLLAMLYILVFLLPGR